MSVRVVVTGLVDGAASVVADTGVDSITPTAMPGYEFYRIWSSDSTPILPTIGNDEGNPAVFPPAEGSRFWLIRFPPRMDPLTEPEQSGLQEAAAIEELGRLLPGLGEAMDPASPGMHTTSTVDYAVVIEGRIGLELGDGSLVELNQGDVLVQNGTPHAWRPVSHAPSLVAFAMVGALRRSQEVGPHE